MEGAPYEARISDWKQGTAYWSSQVTHLRWTPHPMLLMKCCLMHDLKRNINTHTKISVCLITFLLSCFSFFKVFGCILIAFKFKCWVHTLRSVYMFDLYSLLFFILKIERKLKAQYSRLWYVRKPHASTIDMQKELPEYI